MSDQTLSNAVFSMAEGGMSIQRGRDRGWVLSGGWISMVIKEGLVCHHRCVIFSYNERGVFFDSLDTLL